VEPIDFALIVLIFGELFLYLGIASYLEEMGKTSENKNQGLSLLRGSLDQKQDGIYCLSRPLGNVCSLL